MKAQQPRNRMLTFLTRTGHGQTVVKVIYSVKDELVDRIQVYKADVDVTDVLSYNQIIEIESEAAMHYAGEA
jgi:hypothetical protein